MYQEPQRHQKYSPRKISIQVQDFFRKYINQKHPLSISSQRLLSRPPCSPSGFAGHQGLHPTAGAPDLPRLGRGWQWLHRAARVLHGRGGHPVAPRVG